MESVANGQKHVSPLTSTETCVYSPCWWAKKKRSCIPNENFHHMFFLLTVCAAAALTKYVLLHAACIKVGHMTLSLHCALKLDPLQHISVQVYMYIYYTHKLQKYMHYLDLIPWHLSKSWFLSVLAKWLSQWNISSSSQRILGHNGVKSILDFIKKSNIAHPYYK